MKKGRFVLGTLSFFPQSQNGFRLDSAVCAVSGREIALGEMLPKREEAAVAFPNLPASVLKQADEQALPALLALADAIRQGGHQTADFREWGLVVAARTPGRRRIAEALIRFRQQGAWSVSPHLIPNCSLHSISGIISQALQLHGPNLGAGGPFGCEAEALWAAFSWLAGEQLPGVWLLFSAWDQESTTNQKGVCRAVALGLTRASPGCAHFPRSQDDREKLPVFAFEQLWEGIHASHAVRWRMAGAECVWHPQTIENVKAA